MQMALWGAAERPRFDDRFERARRHHLGAGAWVERVPEWLSGHEAAFRELEVGIGWRSTTQVLFDATYATPRQVAFLPEDGPLPGWAEAAAKVLGARYGVCFDRISANYYRSGADSVAWHRDREYRERSSAVVAVLSLGAPRRFVLRPHAVHGDPELSRASVPFSAGWGDLMVMGGTCQRTWEHGIPKVRHADPRICVMFRHDPDRPPATGLDESGPSRFHARP